MQEDDLNTPDLGPGDHHVIFIKAFKEHLTRIEEKINPDFRKIQCRLKGKSGEIFIKNNVILGRNEPSVHIADQTHH